MASISECSSLALEPCLQIPEVQQLFESHGAVLDVKLFPCLDQLRGASALVRMASIEASERAINALNNVTPPGGVQSLIVRFAESPAEKAARLTRRERQQIMQRTGLQSMSGGLASLDPLQLQQTIAALSLNSMAMPQGQAGLRAGPLAGAPMVSSQYHPVVQSSICIKGMPNNADRLWMYENFARFGAIAGMRILIDEATGLCNGTGFINYADSLASERARQAMNGMRAGDKILQVAVQQSQRQHPAAPMMPTNSLAAAMTAGLLPAQSTGDWQQVLQQGAGGAMVW